MLSYTDAPVSLPQRIVRSRPLMVATVPSDKYEMAFGFTEAEVFQSMEEYGLSGQKQEVRRCYDGFTFGRHSNIYNPWSIRNCLEIT